MPPQLKITVDVAKALVMRSEKKTDAKIAAYLGKTAVQVKNSLLATAKRRKWVNRYKVDWEWPVAGPGDAQGRPRNHAERSADASH